MSWKTALPQETVLSRHFISEYFLFSEATFRLQIIKSFEFFVSKSAEKCQQTKTLWSVEDSTNEAELCFSQMRLCRDERMQIQFMWPSSGAPDSKSPTAPTSRATWPTWVCLSRSQRSASSRRRFDCPAAHRHSDLLKVCSLIFHQKHTRSFLLTTTKKHDQIAVILLTASCGDWFEDKNPFSLVKQLENQVWAAGINTHRQ